MENGRTVFTTLLVWSRQRDIHKDFAISRIHLVNLRHP